MQIANIWHVLDCRCKHCSRLSSRLVSTCQARAVLVVSSQRVSRNRALSMMLMSRVTRRTSRSDFVLSVPLRQHYK